MPMTEIELDLSALHRKHERALRAIYGSLLTVDDLAKVLRYRTTHAVRKARSRGALPVTMVRIPPRQTWFAPVSAVALLLAKLELGALRQSEREADMT